VHPQYCLFIDGEPCVSAVPEFVIKKENRAVMVVIEVCAVLLFVGVTTGSEMLYKRLT